MKKIQVLLAFITVTFLVLIEGVAFASPLINQSDLNPLDTVIDFETLTPNSFISSPFTINGATFSSDSSIQVVNIEYPAMNTYPTIVHGNFLTSPYDSAASVPIRITFSQPVSEIGVGIFDPNYPGNVLRVFGSSGQLLEAVESDIWEPGGAFADFIGVIREHNDIYYGEVIPGPGTTTGDYIGIDNVTFSTIPVPEPATMLLLASGLVGLVGFRRLRKN